MTALPQTRMTVDEFLAWVERQPAKYELHNGYIVQMSPEGAGHAKIKFALQSALATAIRARGLPCHMLPDGMTVRVEEGMSLEPDALVYCGPEIPSSAIEVPHPVILVEVLSPSTRHTDATLKVASYFKLPRVKHYLVVAHPTEHHAARRARSCGAERSIGVPLGMMPVGLSFLIA
jgi:Uma2 family endonuclease